MKRFILLIAISISLCNILAFPARIQSWDLARDVSIINKLQISIDRVSHTDGSIQVYLRGDDEFQTLLALGFDPIRLPDTAKEYFAELWESTKDTDNPLNQYYSIDQYHAFMQNTAAQYPDICQLHQYGTSVQGRPLYIMKISDNVAMNEAEPEVKLVASIHGDETVGYDLMIRTIQWLCENYGSDARATSIVNNTELWISPLVNPDGYVLAQRYNANGIDLNRNFPMPTGVTNPDGNPTATENLDMMAFSHEHNFAIGINFHGGALVINYPWDYTYTLAPDDALIRDLSLTYSIHNSPMYNSTEFPQGITKGAAWYVITGSMQDWNYGFTSNIELTAEVSNVKWPPASTLDTYWSQNQESILSFIEYAQTGAKGLITNDLGLPISASIRVSGNSRETRNDPVVGDYHRVLLPGIHTITASAEGYLPQSLEALVPDSGYGTANFVLEAAQQVTFRGIVRDSEGYPISGANVQLLASTPQSAVTLTDGSFLFSGIYEGDYQLLVSAESHALFSTELRLRDSSLVSNAVIVLGDALFMDDFETDLNNWVATTPWGRTQDNGTWVLTDSPSGNYGNNWNRAVRLQSPVSLVGAQNPVLSFRARWDLEAGYDYVYVEGSTDNSNWTEIASFTGTQDSWTEQVFALDGFAGNSFYLRFRLRSDWSQTADGIYIDDVAISGRIAGQLLWGDANADGLISSEDAQAVLMHAVGYALDTENMPAADVNQAAGITAFDAYQIHLYTIDPDFRFPAQSQNAFTLPQISYSYSVSDDPESDRDLLAFTFSPSEQLKTLYLDFPFPVSYGYLSFQDEPWMNTINPEQGKIAMISAAFPATISIKIPSGLDSFDVAAEINGHPLTIGINTSSADDIVTPALPLALNQNHPNPFNPDTNISFSMPETAPVSLKIFNLKGQVVKTLVSGIMAQGQHRVSWNGLDDSGQYVASGMYFYRLEYDGKTLTRKMVLSK